MNLFIEKYRPSSISDYIGSSDIKQKCEQFIKDQEIPHLLFHGRAGTGKTSLSKILTASLDCDYIYINASDENNVDTVRNKIKGFASTIGFNKWKIIVLDEADYLTPAAQSILRNLMETFSNTTRFILTCNYVEKIIEPIRSRCQSFKVTPPSMKDIALRCDFIMAAENISYDPADLKTIIENGYPDIRKIIGEIQSNTHNNTLTLSQHLTAEADIENKIIDILSSKQANSIKFTKIRQLFLNSDIGDYTSFYSMLYKRIDEYAPNHIAEVILIISEADSKSVFAIDKEITAMATLIKILNIING